MAYSLIGILLHTFPKRLFSNHFTNVLINEVSAIDQISLDTVQSGDIRCEIMRCAQAEPFLFRLYNVEFCVLLFREPGYQLPLIFPSCLLIR